MDEMNRADEKRRLEQVREDWRWMIGHAQGRRILAELVAWSGMMDHVSIGNPLQTAHAEGARSLGLRLYARFTEASDIASRPALLAEVLCPSDVRNSRARPTDRDDADPTAG